MLVYVSYYCRMIMVYYIKDALRSLLSYDQTKSTYASIIIALLQPYVSNKKIKLSLYPLPHKYSGLLKQHISCSFCTRVNSWTRNTTSSAPLLARYLLLTIPLINVCYHGTYRDSIRHKYVVTINLLSFFNIFFYWI